MKRNQIGSIIADIFLGAGLFAYLCLYAASFYAIFNGTSTGLMGLGGIVYGWKAFFEVFIWTSIGYALFGVIPLITVYDIIFTIIKIKRNTITLYQKIILIATFALTVLGLILFFVGGQISF